MSKKIENKYLIYKHTNKINGKIYIGITKNNIETRYKYGEGYKSQVFGKAIEKYGWENFEHEVLKDNLTLEEAKSGEVYYISFYKDKIGWDNLYNQTEGGDYGIFSGEIICVETGEVFNDAYGVIEKYSDLNHSDVINICQRKINYVTVKIKGKNKRYHFQYYTSVYREAKNVSQLKEIYKRYSEEKQKEKKNNSPTDEEREKYKNFNKELTKNNPMYSVCENCGDIIRLKKRKFSYKYSNIRSNTYIGQKYCKDCKTESGRREKLLKKICKGYEKRKLASPI